MKSIDFFKLSAKNLLRDYMAEFATPTAGEWAGRGTARFFDVPAIAMEFDVNTDGNLTLMQAQHIIARMVGLRSWGELNELDDTELERRRDMLNMNPYKLSGRRVYAIDVAGCPRVGEPGPMGDYLVRCDKTPELMDIIRQTPDCLFLSVRLDDAQCAAIDADDEHLYVNVCPAWHEIRVHVPGTDWDAPYAVAVKNV